MFDEIFRPNEDVAGKRPRAEGVTGMRREIGRSLHFLRNELRLFHSRGNHSSNNLVNRRRSRESAAAVRSRLPGRKGIMARVQTRLRHVRSKAPLNDAQRNRGVAGPIWASGT